jgi:hypothetical protein
MLIGSEQVLGTWIQQTRIAQVVWSLDWDLTPCSHELLTNVVSNPSKLLSVWAFARNDGNLKLSDAHVVLRALLLPSWQGCRSETSGIRGTSWVDSLHSSLFFPFLPGCATHTWWDPAADLEQICNIFRNLWDWCSCSSWLSSGLGV